MSITIHPSMLSDERRNDPRRRAEMAVLDQLTASDYQGTAIYEWSAGHGAQEIDVPIWIRDMGRYALQVKGGTYIIRDYNWFLTLPDGTLEKKPSPVFRTWDGAMTMRRAVEDVIGFQVYIIPVLVLPDMDPDPHVTALAAQKNVHVVWRGEDLMTRLAEIATREVVRHPPTQAHIENEVHAIDVRETVGAGYAGAQGSPGTRGARRSPPDGPGQRHDCDQQLWPSDHMRRHGRRYGCGSGVYDAVVAEQPASPRAVRHGAIRHGAGGRKPGAV